MGLGEGSGACPKFGQTKKLDSQAKNLCQFLDHLAYILNSMWLRIKTTHNCVIVKTASSGGVVSKWEDAWATGSEPAGLLSSGCPVWAPHTTRALLQENSCLISIFFLKCKKVGMKTNSTTFFFFNFYLFIYLFLAVLGLCCCARAFSSCGERGLLFAAVSRLLIAVASLVAEHGL